MPSLYTPLAPAWLTARPIAHRGLHDGRTSIENTPSAARAAIAKNFAVECDVQLSADGEAVVFHDFQLGRLTEGSGAVSALSAAELAELPMKSTSDHIVSFQRFLAVIGGRVPLVCEIKSRFDGDMRLARRTAEIAAAYEGPLALKSFDPSILAFLQSDRQELGLAKLPLGMIAQEKFDYDEWASMTPDMRSWLANFLHLPETRPDFLSYRVDDLPQAVPFLCRKGLGLPVMTWTVRTAAQLKRARDWADQIVFEGEFSGDDFAGFARR